MKKTKHLAHTQHTPTPYYRDDEGFIASGIGNSYVTVADTNCNLLDINTREANVEFIIGACNMHDSLKTINSELLEALKAAYSDLNLYWRDDTENRGLATHLKACIGKAQGASMLAPKVIAENIDALAEVAPIQVINRDLLQALKQIAEGCSFPEDDVQRAVLKTARAAIAKANGGEI